MNMGEGARRADEGNLKKSTTLIDKFFSFGNLQHLRITKLYPHPPFGHLLPLLREKGAVVDG